MEFDTQGLEEPMRSAYPVSVDNGNRSQKVKRPLNAYNIFYLERQPKLKQENPLLSGNDISRQVGIEWKEMNEDQKKPYKEKARDIYEKFKQENPDYHYDKSSEKKAVKKSRNNDHGFYGDSVSGFGNNHDSVYFQIGALTLANFVLTRKDILDDISKSVKDGKLSMSIPQFDNESSHYESMVPEVE